MLDKGNVRKGKHSYLIINVAIYHQRVIMKIEKEADKYEDRRMKLATMWVALRGDHKCYMYIWFDATKW